MSNCGILSTIVTLDSQEPKTGPKKRLESVLDFACGSGSLLLNVRHRMKDAGGTIGKIFGQEKNIQPRASLLFSSSSAPASPGDSA